MNTFFTSKNPSRAFINVEHILSDLSGNLYKFVEVTVKTDCKKFV